MGSRYDEVYAQSVTHPEKFWGLAAEGIHWERRWDRVLNNDNPPFTRWFEGDILNTCYNVLDRHVKAGRAGQPALIYDSLVTSTVKIYTYSDLMDHVTRCAGDHRRPGPAILDEIKDAPGLKGFPRA